MKKSVFQSYQEKMKAASFRHWFSVNPITPSTIKMMHSIFEILPGSLKYNTPIIDITVIQQPVQTG
mgnify:FL=1